MIPEQFIQELLNRIDIVDVIDKSVPLKKAGANYAACCPFHHEKSPSFTVSATKQFYHCFGCGVHGSAIGFLMEYQGISFVEAVHELAKMVGMIVPQETRETGKPAQKIVLGLHETLQQAANYYKAELKKSTRAIDYLKGRGLSGHIAAKFQIGYAPEGWQNLKYIASDYASEALNVAGLVVENEQGKRYDRFRDRVMFPIHNQKGEVIGFGGRVINPEDSPKYYNSPETPLFQKGHELYGLFLARRAIRDADRVLVVEGYMDVVALAQYDIDYAVAALGTATTPFHIAKLMRQTSNIIFCFDGDRAGRTAAWRAAMNALPALTDGLKLSFLFLPDEHDPDTYVREFGKENFEVLIENATPLSRYIIEHLMALNSLQSQEDKVRFINDAEPILKQIQAPRLSMMLRKRIEELTGVSQQELQEIMPMHKRRNAMPATYQDKRTRAPVSLKKKLALMLIMRPMLAQVEDVSMLMGSGAEDVLLRAVIEIALSQPQSKPAAILHQLEMRLGRHALTQELSMLDESLDFETEILGARKQLHEAAHKMHLSHMLASAQEKPLSALTDEERELLKSLWVKK